MHPYTFSLEVDFSIPEASPGDNVQLFLLVYPMVSYILSNLNMAWMRKYYAILISSKMDMVYYKIPAF